MRILAAADIHGAPFVYEWLVSQTASADVLVLAGDLFAVTSRENQSRQRPVVLSILQRSRISVLYLMGNMDHLALDHEDASIQPLHGRRIEIGEYNFVGYQYTPPFAGHTFMKRDAEIAADLPAIEPLLDDRTVLVTHTPAFGALDFCHPKHVGSRALAGLLQRRPVLARIHGHIHHEFGADGNHFNVASAAECRAMLIELPSVSHQILRHAAL